MRSLTRFWTTYRPGGITTLPQGPTGNPVLGDFGPDFRNWIKQPGDQHIIVPAGTYTGGSVTVSRTATGGTYNGWLVLESQTPGGAVIDMSYPGKNLGGGLTANGDLVFENGDVRTLLIGFKPVNGTIRVATNPAPPSPAPNTCRYLRFWYGDHSFPYTAWLAEPGNPGGGYHYDFRCVDARLGSVFTEFYGCDFHDNGTSLFPRAGGRDFTAVGCHMQTMSSGGYLSYVHPDGVGMVGGNYARMTITDGLIDCSNGGSSVTGVIVEDAAGPCTDITLARLWIPGNSSSGGINLMSHHAAYGISGSMNDVHTWGNGVFELNESVDDDGVHFYTGPPNWSPRIQMSGTGNTFGVAQTGTDPATAWRTAHPYNSWSTFFAGNWP